MLTVSVGALALGITVKITVVNPALEQVSLSHCSVNGSEHKADHIDLRITHHRLGTSLILDYPFAYPHIFVSLVAEKC